jgi:hypothetical protein
MPYKQGDEPATWTLAGTEFAYQEGDITEEEFKAWRAKYSRPESASPAGNPS